jgi:chitinase
MGQVPASVSDVDVAFSIADSNQISDPQNTYPLKPGIDKIHKRGGHVLLSFGGASSTFDITSVGQFESNLGAYFAAHKGYYDGADFDDENIQSGTATLLTGLVNATRTNFPNDVVSFDAFMDGTDPANPFEAPVLQNAAASLSYVNVMDYDQYGYKPSNYPNCTWKTGSPDDCYLDVLANFAAVLVPGSGTFPKSKIVMGLMIGPADDGAVITPQDAASYASFVLKNGYGGVMIWDVDRDGPKTTGHPKGAYIHAIADDL